MKDTNQMNGLYPIVRRVRRPLLPADVLPDGHRTDAKPAASEMKPVVGENQVEVPVKEQQYGVQSKVE